MPTIFNPKRRNAIFINTGGTVSPTPAPPSFSNTKSLAFDGVDESVHLGTNLTDLKFTGAFTLSCWVKFNSLTGIQGILEATSEGAVFGSDGYLIWKSSGNKIQFYIRQGGSWKIATSTTTVTTGTWYHIGATWDGVSTSKIYINGIEEDSNTTITSITYPTTTSHNIGGYQSRGGSPFIIDGLIDEVSFYNGLENINDIYNSGTPNNLSDLNPVAWYRMGDNSTYQTPQILMPENTNKDKVSNWSLEFDGVDDYIGIGSTSLGITSAITVSAWVKIPTTNTGGPAPNIQQLICEDAVGGTSRNWNLYWRHLSVSNKNFYFIVWHTDGSSTTVQSTGIVPNDGNWHHLMGTFDGTTDANGLKLYVDGTLFQTTAGSTGIRSTAGVAPSIGANESGNARRFEGNIDEVAIWDSVQDINDIYNSGTPTTISGATAYWKLGEQSKFTDNWLVPNSALSNYSKFSFDFDGVDDTIDLGLISELNNTSAYTLSMWVNPSVLSGLQFLFAIVTSTTERVFINLNNAIPNVGMSNGTNSSESFNSAPLTVDTWHHLAVVFDGTQTGADRLTFYLNGAAETTTVTTWDSTTPTFVTNAFLSNYAQFGLYYFNGKIDETAIYDTALNSTQVSELYNSGEPTTIPSGAVAHWRMGEDATYNSSTSEWTIPDQVGSNDGTSSNTMALNTLVGEAPNYTGGGLSDAMTIEDRVGDAPNSNKNAVSYNMEAIDIDNNTP